MVAADGCHSSVRKSLNISFEGIWRKAFGLVM
jgi:2-polyprenyl-6-methoxyphenol hydroxylase-like FAD-dependent oxidoreductase